ncbi:response regulator [Segetibacter sp.]|jgi:chemotaxis family two-component system response regulator Rcp1|uniref:response regulator n=1 Tax=Segetibacter sp. TaxID=2231182 RepID=UPI002636ACF5|nr:response regulator [Segetibacter sp.]MCW3080555.1 response regulator receiver protein [Segetibacter sp.]
MTKTPTSPFKILIADDDTDDVQLTKECFLENKISIQINEVYDGQLLMDHLKAHAKNLPHLILLDLNMPRKGGFEALEEIKNSETLRKIPVVIFSTSEAQQDVEKAYDLGASCFISKPNNFQEWCDKMHKIGKFWVECVRLPH